MPGPLSSSSSDALSRLSQSSAQTRLSQANLDTLTSKDSAKASLLDNKVVYERLENFCILYCPGVSIDEMKGHIQAGEELEKQLADVNMDVSDIVGQIQKEDRPTAVKSLMWLLTAKTAVTDERYTSGAMRIEDPGRKVEAFIKMCGDKAVYARISTHMKENLKGEPQSGLDLRSGLPAGKKTLLFAAQPDGTLYLKMEEKGCPPFWTKPFRSWSNFSEYVGHAAQFIITRFKKGGIGMKQARKEHVPKQAKQSFEVLLKTIGDSNSPKEVQTHIKEGQKFGLSRMDKILSKEYGSSDQELIENFKKEHLHAQLQRAESKGYNKEVKGNEVVLPKLGAPLDMPPYRSS
ncbi:hypothetical protein PHSC3_000572 [Chlamydiales bacterium STE3]|nr:hypothetical protein PHSC3_000572 [Chlamydiales bacterium STE3]